DGSGPGRMPDRSGAILWRRLQPRPTSLTLTREVPGSVEAMENPAAPAGSASLLLYSSRGPPCVCRALHNKARDCRGPGQSPDPTEELSEDPRWPLDTARHRSPGARSSNGRAPSADLLPQAFPTRV